MKRLQKEKIADAKGAVLPATAGFGGLKLTEEAGGRHFLMEATVFNPRTATCGVCGFGCLYPLSLVTVPGGFDLLIAQQSGDITVNANMCDGTVQTGWGCQCNFSSKDTTVATVEALCIQHATGVGVGSTSLLGTATGIPGPRCGEQTLLTSCSVRVTPTVSISGPSYVPLRTGTSTGPNSMTLTSTVNPSGGTYSWTTSSNKVSLSNTSSANVTVTSAAASTASGDVPITLTYTANGQSAPATVNITVRKPTSLQLVSGSDTTNPTGHTCSATATSNTCSQSGFTGSGTYTSYVRNRAYHIMDQFSPPQWIQGYNLDIQESYTAPTGQCAGNSVVTGSGPGDTVTDCFFFCSATCQSGGSCSVSATQTITVNGFSVGTESVTVTCSGVTIQP